METIKFVGFVVLILGFVNGKPAKYSPPVILSTGGREIIVNATNNLTLLCEGKEEITWTYPNNTVEGNYWSVVNVSTSKSNLRYFAQLTISNASFVDVDYYYCHAQYAAKDDPQRSDKIYVYVRDNNHLSVKPSEEIEFLTAVQHSTIILPCRPTSPDVTVNLFDINGEEMNLPFDQHIGYSLKVMSLLESGHYTCRFTRDSNSEEELMINLSVGSVTDYVAKPYIEAPSNGRTKVGSTYTLNCTVTVEQNIYFTLNWTTPNPAAEKAGRIISTVATATEVQGHKQGSSSLIIKDVQHQDAGEYTCIITDHTQKNNSFSKTITVFGENGSYINLKEETEMSTLNVTSGTPNVQWVVLVDSFPKAVITWYNNRGDEITKGTKYEILFDDNANKATLKIKQVTLNDSGNYTIVVNNSQELKNLNFTLIVYATPTVHIESDNYHIIGKYTTLVCKAAGFPIPSIEWHFQPCEFNNCKFEKLPKDMYSSKNEGLVAISTLKMNATVTGVIKCTGNSNSGSDTNEQGFYVTDIGDTNNGLVISVSQNYEQVAANSEVSLNCAVSKYNYTNDITWYMERRDARIQVYPSKRFRIKNETTEYSYRSTLIIGPILKNDSAEYICESSDLEESLPKAESVVLTVKDPVPPNITRSNMNGTTINLSRTTTSHFWRCEASGIPEPTITWKKDGENLPIEVNNKHITLSPNKTVLSFSTVIEEDAGTYTCEAKNSQGSATRSMTLKIDGKNSHTALFVTVTLMLMLGFLILVTILIVKIKKEKKLRRELRIAGLANFEKGELESLNPELGIDEQAELLPYDKKWEVPREKLKLGKQLGSGAFGVVMKGEAFGIIEGETVSTVAVKMVKRNADYTYIKALASELKIMVHLGKHLNVVNLLGACTKNVTKRELLVIVEYCRFGNLHNYLLRHRDDFVNQIDLKTGQIDTSIGEELLSRTMSVGSNQSGPSRAMAFAGVDYRATPNISSTTDSTVVCSPTGEDVMILSNNSSVQPEWRSNYRGDYNYKGNVRPTSTHDLLCWAFQVARGMEYLASRKVMHGDLAARNILLAEDNIVKICDFGLAKSMYKSDNYKKKGDGPLPVKWMAVESIRDRVFSTQSDVWSFGIVLWELFSLARTPYPGMEADERLYNKLVDGYRMDQPDYATKEIYQIMMECWHGKPVYRPSFTKLAEDLGNMLQDTVKKHYIDLNDPYIMMNTEQLAGHSDYLAMACSPDYGNLASPGPEYVNGKQYPEEQQPEASGYLPMDVFSPRSIDSVFSFDVSKNKNVDGEPATGVELVPMLHSTESDNETSPTPTKSFSNPNYQINPNVDSNKINTPKKDSIVSTSDNYINMPQQKSAVKNNSDSFSNPSYIHMNNKSFIGEENDKSNYVNSHSRDWDRPIVK